MSLFTVNSLLKYGPARRIGSVKQVFSRTSRFYAAPVEPKTFNKGFSIARKKGLYKLELENAHENDSKIQFIEESHTYLHQGKQMDYSVTKHVEGFFLSFDPDDVIRKMKNSNNWPRTGYMKKDGTAMSYGVIRALWDSRGLYSRNKGIWMHYNIELFLNDLEPSPTLPEMQMFYEFENNFILARDIIPYRTEWRIAAPDVGLAGSVDFVGKLPDGTFCIMDWKSTKKSEEELLASYGKKAKSPLENVPDCEGIKYFLQMNCYKYILETYYGMKISLMILAIFNSTKFNKYYSMEAPDMTDEVKRMINEILKGGKQRGATAGTAAAAAQIPF